MLSQSISQIISHFLQAISKEREREREREREITNYRSEYELILQYFGKLVQISDKRSHKHMSKVQEKMLKHPKVQSK